MPHINIAAAVIGRPSDDRVLVVRKRGSAVFMQPGGKIEPGETALAGLARELWEEIGFLVLSTTPAYLGRFEAPAANEPGYDVVAEVYVLTSELDLGPRAEIEELRWIDPAETGGISLAALSRDLVLPAYLRSRLSSIRS